jgi:hypothetical protein
VRPVSFDAALVDVADKQVRAALVAEVPDLPQQLSDRDAGFLGPAFAEVVAVRVDEGGTVFRDALQPARLAGAVIALDGVEREVQAAGALEQAHVPGPQFVDLLPALQSGGSAFTLLQGQALSPAGRVRRDFLADGLAEAMPRVPAVADLHRAGQRLADRLAIGPRPVPAHDLSPGMVPQPLPGDVSGAAGDNVDAAASPGVDEDGRIDAAAAQREVIDPQHPRYRQRGKGDPQEHPQRGVPGYGDAQRRHQPRRGPAR